MPFGLFHAPATFQRTMDRLIADIRHFAGMYIDDLLIFSETLEEHIEHLEIIFRKMEQEKFYCNLEKCHFAQREVEFCGFIVGVGGSWLAPKPLSVGLFPRPGPRPPCPKPPDPRSPWQRIWADWPVGPPERRGCLLPCPCCSDHHISPACPFLPPAGASSPCWPTRTVVLPPCCWLLPPVAIPPHGRPAALAATPAHGVDFCHCAIGCGCLPRGNR